MYKIYRLPRLNVVSFIFLVAGLKKNFYDQGRYLYSQGTITSVTSKHKGSHLKAEKVNSDIYKLALFFYAIWLSVFTVLPFDISTCNNLFHY